MSKDDDRARQEFTGEAEELLDGLSRDLADGPGPGQMGMRQRANLGRRQLDEGRFLSRKRWAAGLPGRSRQSREVGAPEVDRGPLPFLPGYGAVNLANGVVISACLRRRQELQRSSCMADKLS